MSESLPSDPEGTSESSHSDPRDTVGSIVLPPQYTAVETIFNSSRYRIVRAEDSDGLKVVLKMALGDVPGARQRLRNELDRGRELADAFDRDARLKPHRLRYYDLVLSHRLALESRPVLVMEDVGGRSLDLDLPPQGLSLERWLELAIQAATLLRGLHRQHLIHKQIQPAHMILGEDDRLRWIGLGQSSKSHREHARAVPPRQLESSLAYLSPEQTGRMNRPVDYRSDFYSLGVTLYQLLTGRLPFQTTDVADLVHSHLAKEPPSPLELRPSLPVVVADMLRRLMAKNAEDRYQSASGLLSDLHQCSGHFQLSGKIPNFSLAGGEKTQHFELPQKLYGRATHIEQLERAFDRSRAQPAVGIELLLVEGLPGTGKSSLPLELYKPISRDRGHLVRGRFDPFRREIPYSGWVRACSELCRHILTEPAHALEAWRQRIRSTVGESNLPGLLELIPRLFSVLGPERPAAAEALPPESAARLLSAFRHLIAAFATPSRPLVIFLDNLHCADRASLQLFEELALGEPIPHCLVVATFNRPEVVEGHPLEQALTRIEAATGTPELIRLGNLERGDVAQLIAEAFGCEPSDCRPLADLVHTKTNGNPHFVRQFLGSLHDQGLLTLETSEKIPDSEPAGSEEPAPEAPRPRIIESRWVWDLEGVRALSITDNVVELLNHKIDELPEKSRDALRLAACLGASFELGALATAAGQGRGATLRQLGPCLKRHLVITVTSPPQGSPSTRPAGKPDEDEHRWFRFSHDRVQQAAYAGLDPAEQQEKHLQIARRLHELDDALSRNLLFETLSHYLRAEPKVTDPSERIRILELTLAASEKALASAAYPTAADYLQSGLSKADDRLWSRERTLAFELHKTYLQSLGMATRFDQADALFARLSRRELSREERFTICRIRLEQLTTRGLYADALDLSGEALELLGSHLPTDEKAAEEELKQDLLELPELLAGRSIEDLRHSPPLTDAAQGRLLKALGDVATSAFPSGRPMLVAWAGCRRVHIILRHGLQPGDALAFAGFAYSTLIHIQGDYDSAYRYGRLAIEVVEDSPSLSARARGLVMFAGSIQHWCEPLGETLPHFRKALRYALESGDLIFASYAIWFLFVTRFQAGSQLADLDREARRQLTFLNRSYRNNLEGAFRPALLQPIAHLLGQTRGPASFDNHEFNEQAFLEGPGQAPYFRALFLGAKIRGLYWMQRIPEALELIDERESIEENLYAQAQLPEYLLFVALTLTAAFDAVVPEDQQLYLELLDDYEQRFRLWSELCPENCQHRYFLLHAERARISGDFERAVRNYRQAVDVAASTGWVQYEALGNELFGNFWKLSGEPTAALGYWLRARDLYARWGAQAKVDQMHASHAELLAIGPGGRAPSQTLGVGLDAELDLGHALRASRAISSEIRPDELLQALMLSVIEIAGARRGCLLLKRDEQLTVEVTVSLGSQSAPEVHVGSIELDDYPDIAHSVIHFVSRTEEEVVIGDTSASARFSSDPRWAGMRIPSVLCLPMRRHGELAGMLYLENRLTAHVFTAERVALLHTLLAQAAISLENAHLYQDLAHEIQERKQIEDQLRDHNTELESKNAELERFAYTVSHDLRSPLVTIKGFLGLLEEDAEAGRWESMREDIARIHKASNHMSELLEDLLDLSRVGHLAGPPTAIPLLDLIQETLELLTIPLAKAGIEIQMSPPFPVIHGDRVRLREVLQNLVENAAKFMGDQPNPRIEIGTFEDGEGATVIFVRDNGCGIEGEHQKVIFGLFQQLNQSIEGTGVGLTLVRRIVEVHGGRVWVESEGPGHGSTFCFTLRSDPSSLMEASSGP